MEESLSKELSRSGWLPLDNQPNKDFFPSLFLTVGVLWPDVGFLPWLPSSDGLSLRIVSQITLSPHCVAHCQGVCKNWNGVLLLSKFICSPHRRWWEVIGPRGRELPGWHWWPYKRDSRDLPHPFACKDATWPHRVSGMRLLFDSALTWIVGLWRINVYRSYASFCLFCECGFNEPFQNISLNSTRWAFDSTVTLLVLSIYLELFAFLFTFEFVVYL